MPLPRRLVERVAAQPRAADVALVALLFLLPLLLFWAQTLGGRTLLPGENLYQYEPYATYAAEAGAPLIPHNHLVSDLVLENYQWKSFILISIREGELPLWNPHQFSGIPFLAAGQPSTLYPFSLIYYTVSLPAAYGWFTVVQLWLAGAFMYAFARVLGISRAGGALAGVTYQLSAFFVISAVFPMIIGAAAWLPLILLAVELIVRRQTIRGRPAAPIWVGLGALALGCCVLAGHVEILYYTLIITAYYSAARLLYELWQGRRTPLPQTTSVVVPLSLTPKEGVGRGETNPPIAFSPSSNTLQLGVATKSPEWGSGGVVYSLASEKNIGAFHQFGVRSALTSAGWLLALVVLGLGLGAVQFLPTFEHAGTNFRSGSASFEQVLGWAHPPRDIIQFLLPNFYGNPAQHAYYDVFTNQPVSLIDTVLLNADGARVTNTDWGFKNYVEAALYVGILPLVLAVFALLRRGRLLAHRLIFAVLGVFALTIMFGLPTYALLFYTLPGIDQLHSPFRWVFALTLCVAILAGFGLDALMAAVRSRLTNAFAIGLMGAGVLALAAVFVGRAFFPQIESLINRLLDNAVTGNGLPARMVFPEAGMFFSVQAPNLIVLGVMLIGSGVIFAFPRLRRWACLLVAVDLMIASGGFNPASDPAWLDYTPPAVAWLQARAEEARASGEDWRYITLQDRTARTILNANMTMSYRLDDVRGYESIIPRQYVDFMEQLAPQEQLEYNRVAPLYTTYNGFDPEAALTSPLLDALNVRYIVTHTTIALDNVAGFTLAYEDDAVRIWENGEAFPRAMLVRDVDEQRGDPAIVAGEPATRLSGTSRESIYRVTVPDDGALHLLVISQTYNDEWRAFTQREGEAETPRLPRLVWGNFLGVELTTPGTYTIRVVYSPASFTVGAFFSFTSVVLLLLLAGVWGWRAFAARGSDHDLGRVARNSIAPILLNLFNRGIDFAFAFVMLRVLGPEGSGNYTYAGVIFIWFDILTNFGLNLYLTREVARDKAKALGYFINTSALRVGLAGLGVPLLLLFLVARQSSGTMPLNMETILAIGLLYVGLLPNSLSTGMTALFYAHEQAETPAVVATLATVCKAVGGLLVLLAGYGIVGLAAVSIITNFVTLGFLVWSGRAYLTSPSNPLSNGEGEDAVAADAPLFEMGEVAAPPGLMEVEGATLTPSPSPIAKSGQGRGETNPLMALSPSPNDRATRFSVAPVVVEGDFVGGLGGEVKEGWGVRSALNFFLMRQMMGASWPLMLNHFLATIFFQIDVIIIEYFFGGRSVGLYGVAYKWLSALNVIPAFFTQAMLPLMSRQAQGDPAALTRNYYLAIKLLVSVALPTAILFTFLAEGLVGLLGGAEYLPDSAIATQIMIWSIPIGWINSYTQYMLIALDLQRRVTGAFVLGVGFNIVMNLLLVPTYGYRAAALITIASEAILLVPFARLLEQRVGRIDWLGILWRPVVAAGAMFGVTLLLWQTPALAVLASVGVFVVFWWRLGVLTPEERARLAPLLPERLRRAARATS